MNWTLPWYDNQTRIQQKKKTTGKYLDKHRGKTQQNIGESNSIIYKKDYIPQLCKTYIRDLGMSQHI